ncbi:hypothetical protein [Dietzia sp.]|uniref:hypothetical protein n=1 Tax=Dietzia sp. TaxID=1871616 RepID=UPI002FDA8A50
MRFRSARPAANRFDSALRAAAVLTATLAIVAAGTGTSTHADVASTPAGSSEPPLAMVTDVSSTVDAFRTAEKRYSANRYDGSAAPGSVAFVDRTAGSRLVILAPHAVRHFRAGQPKVPDLYTGGIAEVLGERLGATVLATDGKVADWHDNWADRDDAFSRTLDALPADSVFADLHGMSDASSSAHIELGLGSAPTPEAEDLGRRIVGVAPDIITDQGPFNATEAYTDVAHLQGRGRTALQVEMSLSARDPDAGNLDRTIDALASGLGGYGR